MAFETRKERMESLLKSSFSPSAIDVKDVSLEHAGHPGIGDSIETHFRIYMISDQFFGKTQVEAHRLVYKCLESEFKNGLHALEMDLKT